MATNTANYNLVKPSGAPGGDLVDINVIDANMDLIDAGMLFAKLHGIQICTSAARPSSGLFVGMTAYETDTQRYIGWDGTNWRPISPNEQTVWYIPIGTSTWTNQATYAVIPTAGDRTALTTTFNKISPTTALSVQLSTTSQLSSGAAHAAYWGLRIAGVDFDVARRHSDVAATVRKDFNGSRRLTGIAAGNLTIEPVFHANNASVWNMWATDDEFSYSIREVV